MTEDTVFARCVALDASEVLNERQIGWSGRWSLMGDFVICTQCITAQSIDQATSRSSTWPTASPVNTAFTRGTNCNTGQTTLSRPISIANIEIRT
jgi:hypothetical protein